MASSPPPRRSINSGTRSVTHRFLTSTHAPFLIVSPPCCPAHCLLASSTPRTSTLSAPSDSAHTDTSSRSRIASRARSLCSQDGLENEHATRGRREGVEEQAIMRMVDGDPRFIQLRARFEDEDRFYRLMICPSFSTILPSSLFTVYAGRHDAWRESEAEDGDVGEDV